MTPTTEAERAAARAASECRQAQVVRERKGLVAVLASDATDNERAAMVRVN